MDYFSPSQRRGLRSVFVSGVSSPRDVRCYAMERIWDGLNARGIGLHEIMEHEEIESEGSINYSDVLRARIPITRQFLGEFPTMFNIRHDQIFPVRPNLRAEKYLDALAVIEGERRKSDEAAYLTLVNYTEDFAFSKGHLKHAIGLIKNFLKPDTYESAGIETE